MDSTHFVNIESPRLVLRRFAERDLAALLAYLNDPLVARYQSWESYTERQARELIAEQQGREPGRPGEWFTFAAELKETGALVGHVALSVKADDARQAEMALMMAAGSSAAITSRFRVAR
jgi:RimJ/RimL family protein N-acetyltransferase